MKIAKLITAFVLFASQSSAEDGTCEVNGKLKDWFQGYQAERIIMLGDIISSGPKLDVNGNEISETVWYHVMLTPDILVKALPKSTAHMECVSIGIYICTVGLDFKDDVYYHCDTYVE